MKSLISIIQQIFIQKPLEYYHAGIIFYQCKYRIYLDEYPEQDGLRKEYFEADVFTFEKLQKMLKIVTSQQDSIGIHDIAEQRLTKPMEYTLTFTTTDEDGLTYYFEETYEEPDPYFYNRWLKVN